MLLELDVLDPTGVAGCPHCGGTEHRPSISPAAGSKTCSGCGTIWVPRAEALAEPLLWDGDQA